MQVFQCARLVRLYNLLTVPILAIAAIYDGVALPAHPDGCRVGDPDTVHVGRSADAASFGQRLFHRLRQA